MPKRTDIQRILIIGSGPIVIGQGCEFDYSGVQACRALREEGYQVVLIIVRLAITLLASWLSFRFLERPFLRLKRFYPTAGPVDPPLADRTNPLPAPPASIQPST